MKTDRAWAQINLSAIRDNYKEIVRVAGKPSIAVVKANAYGHGAVKTAKCCEELDAPILAVACIDEAIELRMNEITAPILILGVTQENRICELTKYNLMQTVPSVCYAKLIKKYAGQVRVHIKVDTGMGRLGVKSADEVIEIAKMLTVEGIFTHFADSDNVDLSYTERQLSLFKDIILAAHNAEITFKYCHAANSAAVLHCKESLEFDLVRPGLLLYGLYPDERHEDMKLTPVMSLFARVCDVHDIKKGESVSYGRTFTASEDIRVAVLPIGYADGLCRSLSDSGEVFLNGHRVPIIGRICMDMCIVDVSGLENVKVGDVAEIFGENISADELADKIGTISYEICTGVGKRVPRVYID